MGAHTTHANLIAILENQIADAAGNVKESSQLTHMDTARE